MDCWKMHQSIRLFTCGFNTTVLHHITAMKCVSGPKTILDAGVVALVKLQFCGLHAHLTSIGLISYFYFFVWGYLKTIVYASTVDTREEPWSHIQQLVIEKKNTSGIFERLRTYFHADLSYVSVHMEAVSSTSREKVKAKSLLISSSFVCFLHTHNPLNFGMRPWKMKLE
jgi:hypothetical protein